MSHGIMIKIDVLYTVTERNLKKKKCFFYSKDVNFVNDCISSSFSGFFIYFMSAFPLSNFFPEQMFVNFCNLRRVNPLTPCAMIINTGTKRLRNKLR